MRYRHGFSLRILPFRELPSVLSHRPVCSVFRIPLFGSALPNTRIRPRARYTARNVSCTASISPRRRSRQPVVPGVCTLQIIKESAEQIANQPLQYVQIASSKFLSAINPLETPLLQLFIRLEKTEEHLFKLQAEGICNGKEFIKLKAVLMASKYQ